MGTFGGNSQVMERYLTEDEEARLFGTVRRLADIYARRDYAWMRVLLYSGMRISEFSALTVGDAEDALRHGAIFIPAERRKGGRAGRADDLMLRIHARLREALEDLLKIREAMGGETGRGQPLVLSRNGGAAMSVRSYQSRFSKWSREAGIPERASPHWLRHTCAMRIKARTTSTNPLLAIKAQLGHRSLSSTGVYAQTTREEMDAALAETFGGPRRPSKAERRKMYDVMHSAQ